jgi:hypothetical protein
VLKEEADKAAAKTAALAAARMVEMTVGKVFVQTLNIYINVFFNFLFY